MSVVLKKCVYNCINNTQHFFASFVQNQVRDHILTIFKEAGIDVVRDTEKPWNLVLKDKGRKNYKFFIETSISPYLGMGTAYMEGLWESDDLVELLCKLFRSEIGRMCGHWYHRRHNAFVKKLIKINAKHQQKLIGHFYDTNFDLLSHMLGPSLEFSTGDWNLESRDSNCNIDSLSQAMEHKFSRIKDELMLPLDMPTTMRLLVIGSTCGHLAEFLANIPTLDVTCIIYGKKFSNLAKTKAKSSSVKFLTSEDGDLSAVLHPGDKYDRIVSIEPFQILRRKNLKSFFDFLYSKLEPMGKLYLESKGNFNPDFPLDDLFSHAHIFTGGHLPLAKSILEAIQRKWELSYWRNSDKNYIKTIQIWRGNLKKLHSNSSSSMSVIRAWEYNLALYEAALKTGMLNSWEILLCKN